MPEAFSCPSCGYTLEGLGDAAKVRCPECGRTYTWRGLEWWREEGRHVPPISLLYWLIPVPTIALVGGLSARALRMDDAATIGWTLAYLWASAAMGVLVFRGMRRHGGGFAGLLTLLIAPVAGAVVTALVAVAFGALGWLAW